MDRHCGVDGCEGIVEFSVEKGWRHVKNKKADRDHIVLPGNFVDA